ncbi:hypothetical protein LHK_02769 [Laribacter hongkongensis HLHK9]|uniref:Uncharacterized protein n=1 Tax=Laribacter hongkongensis (strain HLHK9) TaxID=557598 RepID=C1DDB7_LARHH|nr:hypothetical protein LHK_02769 [Laribacter hongkongensis HLHK9]
MQRGGELYPPLHAPSTRHQEVFSKTKKKSVNELNQKQQIFPPAGLARS